MTRPIIATAGLAIAFAIANGGCAAHTYGEPRDVYVYEDAPVGIYGAPRVYYEDSWAYYWGGRWYRRTPRGWAYYRAEPPALARRRPYLQEPPPARVYAAPHVTSAPVHREHREHEERDAPRR